MIKDFFQKNKYYMIASFFIPAIIMAIIYLTIGIYPGSERTLLASDAFSQFSNFHASFRNALFGEQSFLYTWNASLGLNYLSLISYYLGGFFTPLVLFFPNQLMPDALYFLTLVKIGSAGLSFWFYAKHIFHISKKSHITLAICYALMSFITAQSELIMWLDAYVYLPLIIWGIDRIIQKGKPKLLFISYFMLFFTSFYLGFMVGVFSVLYFFVQLFRNWQENKKRILPYFVTSFLAGGASMIIILPALLDLRSNGEELTQITNLKTEATGPLDFFIKNMIGVYDTTKYGSIPFIYIGLLPLAFFIFYFIIKEIPWKEKILYASLIALLLASFYFIPLNLLWHGMHAPNMFLFRYAFLFSFTVIMLAGFGWEKLNLTNEKRLLFSFVFLAVAFSLTYLFIHNTKDYLEPISLILSLAFLVVYFIIFFSFYTKQFTLKQTVLFLLLFATVEMAVNTNSMLRNILDEWNYPSRGLYTEPYPAINELVEETKEENDTFYRLENLDPVSANDSFNYGYSGISMFSSIRNRNTSGYMDMLGFRSRGTSLNVRYPNNTLLMDSLMAVKYNLAEQPIDKYGFSQKDTSGDYQLYENQNALPLGFLTDSTIHQVRQVANDNLANQTNLINQLADTEETFFTFRPITVTGLNNVTIENQGAHTKFSEETENTAKEVTWEVTVPAHSQAYLSLFPTNFAELENSTATITVDGQQRESQINTTGQYYDLGFYDQAKTIEFTASFYGTEDISFQNPQVVTLDTDAFQKSIDKIQENGVEMQTGNRDAQAEVTADKDQTLVTTIPYDGGWHAKIDGNNVAIDSFQNAFVSLEVPEGKHTIELTYRPQGFLPGVGAFVICIVLFVGFDWYYEKKRR
ncbi:copper ABC transporter permease [Tetragenococcus osmophilus]|uniref:Copper ABC transporter permease n=1 Tax=Tetragenococcus osmophilus TaxID=526944 RepID=A0AA37XM65_9ENTE|nr:YfhO family protein [Tetragenococcus osmophilus]AYW47904.1 copper ABC transporter permease [Tetragenococcus osmophilus]GMA72454.1 copper ABC transporter permease [Tetragenococcus osmophilus]